MPNRLLVASGQSPAVEVAFALADRRVVLRDVEFEVLGA